MKPRALSLFSVLVLGTSIAQTAPTMPGSERPPANQSLRRSGKPWKGFLDRLGKEVGLSPLQKRRIEGIFEAAGDQREAIMADSSLSPQQKMARLKAWNDQSKRKVRSILTPPQRTKFDALVKKMSRPVGGPRRTASQFNLNLTPNQQQKMGKVMKALKPRYDAIFTNKSLSDVQRRAKVKELNASMEKQINAILTPQQRQKRSEAMRELMEEARQRNQNLRRGDQTR